MQNDYYLDQCNRYFDTLDAYAPSRQNPKYSKDVILWEWPPWLKLTAYGRRSMNLNFFLRLYGTRVTNRKCEFFDIEPQGRCHVVFDFRWHHQPLHIYEEFTFNQAGEISFIEAWTETPEVSAMVEANTLKRLSINRDIADLPKRLKHPIYYWVKEVGRFVVERF